MKEKIMIAVIDEITANKENFYDYDFDFDFDEDLDKQYEENKMLFRAQVENGLKSTNINMAEIGMVQNTKRMFEFSWLIANITRLMGGYPLRYDVFVEVNDANGEKYVDGVVTVEADCATIMYGEDFAKTVKTLGIVKSTPTDDKTVITRFVCRDIYVSAAPVGNVNTLKKYSDKPVSKSNANKIAAPLCFELANTRYDEFIKAEKNRELISECTYNKASMERFLEYCKSIDRMLKYENRSYLNVDVEFSSFFSHSRGDYIVWPVVKLLADELVFDKNGILNSVIQDSFDSTVYYKDGGVRIEITFDPVWE